MVKITNGVNYTQVSLGSYKSIFEPAGWTLCDNNDNIDKSSKPLLRDQNEDDTILELLKKPVSSMRADELRQVAAHLHVETEGRSKKEVQEEVASVVASLEEE